MKDLIDRDALGVGPANPEVFQNTAYADGWNALLRIINQAPAIDAAPVVHGRWLSNGIHGSVLCRCSECHYDAAAYSFRYCPNCGAKMDGEGKSK